VTIGVTSSDATSSTAGPRGHRAVIERSGKFASSKVWRPWINSEFLQLTVVEMPERCPSLLIFAPSPKPKRDVAKEDGRHSGTMRDAR